MSSRAPHYDVAILGGSVAGALCASLLRKQGPKRRVLVLEREQFPRHHVGESTLPGWAPILERAGVLDKVDASTAVRKVGVAFRWGPADTPELWTADFRSRRTGRPAMGAYHVDRAAFDKVLLDHCQSLGADVRQQANVREVLRDSDPFTVVWSEAGQTRTATAEYIVDATGQARFLSRHWGLSCVKDEDMNNYAVYGYWSGSAIAKTDFDPEANHRWTITETCDVGWAWHIQIAPDTFSVGVVTSRDTLKKLGTPDLAEFYRDALQSCGTIAPLLEHATQKQHPPGGDKLRVVSDWAYQVQPCCGDKWFLVGDAAVFIDPVLASGMVLAGTAASMAANAIATVWNKPETDHELLRHSYSESYGNLADAYHRMARIWYQRNFKASSWHWEARKHRLQSGGASLYERDRDAFTLLCLGAVANPLDASVRVGPRDLWGSEFFPHLVAKHLFGDQPGDADVWEGIDDTDEARLSTRRGVLARWRRLVRSAVRVNDAQWSSRERYYTNMFMNEWERVRFVELHINGSTGRERLVFPVFSEHPQGVLPYLDGQRTVGSVIRDLLRGAPVGSEFRDDRLKAMAESIIQLDMAGLLHIVDDAPGPAADNIQAHPAVRVLIASILQSLPENARVVCEFDWLGECLDVRIDSSDDRRAFCFFSAQPLETDRYQLKTDTTALCYRGRLEHDRWAERFAKKVMARLRRRELDRQSPDAHDLWNVEHALEGIAMSFDYKIGERPVAQQL